MNQLNLCLKMRRLSLQSSRFAVVAFVAVLLLVSGKAGAQPLRDVVLIDAIKFPPKAAAQGHLYLHSAMEEALTPKGWPLAQLGRPVEDCGDTSDCLGKIATDTRKNYVLRVSGTKARDFGYDITLDLFTTTTGYARSSHAACDFCDPATMSKIAAGTAVEMLTGAVKEEASKTEASGKEKARMATAPVEPAVQSPWQQPETPTLPAEPEKASWRWVPWTLVGVGAAAMIYGGVALFENNHVTGDKGLSSSSQATRSRYSSNLLGIVTTSGGAAVAVLGLVLLKYQATPSTSVALSPTSIDVAVRF